VVRRDQVGVRADHQLRRIDSALVQVRHLLKQDGRVDDHPVADDRHDRVGEDAAGQQVQRELLVADDDRVSGVVSALVANDIVDPPAEQVRGLSLAFVAPLGAHKDDRWHG
jgi:hypothetical protein